MNHCIRHFEEPVAGICRTCQNPFCDRCLVFSFGTKKPPYCVGCALTASGVRNGNKMNRPAPAAMAFEAGDPAMTTIQPTTALDRRTARAERRADKANARAARRAGVSHTVPTLADGVETAPSDRFVPQPGQLAAHRYEPAAIDQFV